MARDVQPQRADNLRITVADIAGQVIDTLELDEQCRVGVLRQRLHECSNIPFYDQHLLCGSKVLTDDLPLSSLTNEKHVEITLVRASKPCALTAGSDGNLMLWDMGTGLCCRYLPVSTAVLCLAVDWLARVVLSGHSDSSLRLWDLDRGFCLREMDIPRTYSTPRCVEFDWKMKIALSTSAAFGCCMIGSPSPPLGLWDLAAGRFIRGFYADSGNTRCLSSNWARCQALVGGDSLELFDVDLGERQWILKPEGQVQVMVVDWNAAIAITGGDGRRLQVWNLESQTCVQDLPQLGQIQKLQMDRPGDKRASQHLEIGVRPEGLLCWKWDLQEWRCISETLVSCEPSRCVCLDASRLTCLYAADAAEEDDENGDTLKVVDLVSGQEVVELAGHLDHVMCGSIS
eukprot:symbB.v1.2.032075.t1/scaffold3801.1/size50132/2